MLKSLYRHLENPEVYNLVQRLLGSNRVYRAVRNLVETQLQSITYNNVLEVGCGTGLLAGWFKGKYTGIDINQDYIRKAEAEEKGVFMIANATALPFESEAFDLVFTMGVLHHLDHHERKKMLYEMWRVCTHDGHILIIDGIIPSNKLNMIGYILARLDKGRFKLRLMAFKKMIASAYPDKTAEVAFKSLTVFFHEYAVAFMGKRR